MNKVWAIITTLALSIFLLAGCSDEESTQQETERSKASEKAGETEEKQQATDNTNAGVAEEVNTSEVLVEQEYQHLGTEDSFTIGVHSLQVEGDIMTLMLVLTPDFQSVDDSERISIYDMYDPTKLSMQPVLLDRDNLKEYSMIMSNGQAWSIDTVETETLNNEPVVWWGVYSAPQDDIDEVDIRIFDDMSEFTSVPVQR